MATSAILFVDDDQGFCTSLPDVIWDLDYPGSGAHDGPAARELSRRYTSGLALLDYRSPGTDGVELGGRLKQVQSGTAGVPVTADPAHQGGGRGGAVTVRHKTGKEAQPCAPARCWAPCFLPRKEGARKGLCGGCVQPSVTAVHAVLAQAPIRWCAGRRLHRFGGTMKGKARPITSSAKRPAASSRDSRASGRSELALAGDCP